ncbi:hypothetical protein Cantr_10428 [Candida viswanathii]|uniref:Uncharacterized protein n=1 Tax=Candida viswanathii TaxID=5486 RepID=A0A367YF71_9ASCO|nr:hypothetical protein Cantr_10428 [Candida viswanathii]
MAQPPNYKEEAPPAYEHAAEEEIEWHAFRSQLYANLVRYQEVKFNHTQEPQYMPTIDEATTHLKLLKSFGKLKESVLDNYEEKKDPLKIERRWKVFVTLAVRRFILFISALKLRASKFNRETRDIETTTDNRSREFTKIANELVPPLDVIMVWHAFMLNPMTFYDVFVRNDMYYFINHPFPFHIIEKYIDNQTFEFLVPDDLKKNYLTFLGEFSKNDADLRYEIDVTNFLESTVTLYCPNTGRPISEPVPITTSIGKGFADPGFLTNNVGHRYAVLDKSHSGRRFLNHDELRVIKLDHDVASSGGLEGVFKFYSKALAEPEYDMRDPILLNQEMTSEVVSSANECFAAKFRVEHTMVHFPRLKNIIMGVNSRDTKRAFAERLVLRSYLKFNVISLSVQNGVQIGEDLVDCVVRQGSFVDKMNTLDWFHLPLLEQGLAEALFRYYRFFKLLTDEHPGQMLVPTLDIDLMWHTHQLMLYGYIRDCKYSPIHTVIDHNDKVEKKPLDKGYLYTCQLYKERYDEEYSICFCNYCIGKRGLKTSKLSAIFTSQKALKAERYRYSSNPLYEYKGEGVTHGGPHGSLAGMIQCAGEPNGCCQILPSRDGNTYASGIYAGAECAGRGHYVPSNRGSGLCGGSSSGCGGGGCGGGG